MPYFVPVILTTLRNYLKYLLFPLMIGYLLVMNTITRDRHFHILAGKEVVYHIHPVDKNTDQPFRNHTHSTVDYFDFQCNTLDFQESSVHIYIPLCMVNPADKFKEQYSPFVFKNFHFCLSLRAPPSQNI